MDNDGNNLKEQLIAGYHAAVEQNKLYADFRWKVFSYISTLQAGLFFLAFNLDGDVKRVICSIMGLFVSVVLWLLERRHHSLFTQSRDSGQLFEDRLGLKDVGVFSIQMRRKKGWGHYKLISLITSITAAVWILLLVYSTLELCGF